MCRWIWLRSKPIRLNWSKIFLLWRLGILLVGFVQSYYLLYVLYMTKVCYGIVGCSFVTHWGKMGFACYNIITSYWYLSLYNYMYICTCTIHLHVHGVQWVYLLYFSFYMYMYMPNSFCLAIVHCFSNYVHCTCSKCTIASWVCVYMYIYNVHAYKLLLIIKMCTW